MEALGINLPGLVTQIISFLILFGLLHIVLYKPILRIMDQRAAKIKESLETADRIKEESAASQSEMESKLDAARQEGQALLIQAREMADRYREEQKDKARQEAEVFVARARDDIQRERDGAIEDVRHHFAELAILAAERVIEHSLDASAQKDIIENVLKESSGTNGS